MSYCAHCGSALAVGAQTCARCGSQAAHADVPAAGAECEICHFGLSSSWRHCTRCESKVTSSDGSRITRTSIAAEAAAYVARSKDGAQIGRMSHKAPLENRWPVELHP